MTRRKRKRRKKLTWDLEPRKVPPFVKSDYTATKGTDGRWMIHKGALRLSGAEHRRVMKELGLADPKWVPPPRKVLEIDESEIPY